jgi:hypothetical protein
MPLSLSFALNVFNAESTKAPSLMTAACFAAPGVPMVRCSYTVAQREALRNAEKRIMRRHQELFHTWPFEITKI